MNATFTLAITIERSVECFTCDHIGEIIRTVKKGRIERILDILALGDWSKEKHITTGYECKKTGALILYPGAQAAKDCPCKFQKWEQTNTDFELTDESRTITFDERDQ